MSYNVKIHTASMQKDKRAVIENFSGGVCIDETNSVISDMQSPDMLNMWYDNNILCTRHGQKTIVDAAYYEKFFQNRYPLYPLTDESLLKLTLSHQNMTISNDGGALKLYTPSTNSSLLYGFTCYITLEPKRKYLFAVSVKNMTRLYMRYSSSEKNELSMQSTNLTLNPDEYQQIYYEFTTGEREIQALTLYDYSLIYNNTSYLKDICIFDVTEIDENFTDIAYIKSFIALDESSVKSYECDFLSKDIISRNVSKELYRHTDGSYSAVRNHGNIGCKVNGMLGEIFYDNYFIHVDENLYSWNGKSQSAPVLIKSNFLKNKKSIIYSFLSRVYIIDGNNYYCVIKDGVNTNNSVFYRVEEVEPYIPIVRINCGPNDRYVAGDTHENFNLLCKSYKVSYSTIANSTTYYFANQSHAVNGAKVELNGRVMSENEYEIITTGVNGYYVRLKSAVSADGLNNLIITCNMSDRDWKESRKKILNCTIAKSFGGTSTRGTRIFLSGNPDEPAKYYRSYIQNCTYFPDMEYEIVGSGTERITAFEIQYGALIAFTETSVYQILYSFDGDTPTFSTKLISPIIGCDMPGSVHLVDNKLVFANTANGVHIIDYFNGTDEKNIKQISLNINGSEFIKKGLLSESREDLKNASSTIFGGRYYLYTKKHTYVWDYGLKNFDVSGQYYDASSENAQHKLVWYIFDNIHSGGFLTMRSENALSYISETEHETEEQKVTIVKFDPYCNDFGKTVKAHFITKSFDFKAFMYKKILKWIAISSYSRLNVNKLLSDNSENTGEYLLNFGNIKFTCICDSIQQKSYLAKINSNSKNFYNYYRIVTSVKKGYHFAFKFESVDGPINISKILLNYSI